MAHPFLEALEKRPLLGDGAMGTLLYARGASPETSFEKMNLDHQDMVQQVHIDYINAGAEVIQTNSFAGNRYRLASYGLEKDVVWSSNVWAAKVARNAREIAGMPVFVSPSPYGVLATRQVKSVTFPASTHPPSGTESRIDLNDSMIMAACS